MFLLNNVPISPDAQFESNGIQYPAGWIRSATPAEKTAAGITEEIDEPRPDDFYAYVYPKPDEPWKWLTTPYTPEEMKPRLANYSKQQREHRELAGVEHVVAGKTRLIPTDRQTRDMFFDLRVIAARPGPPEPKVVQFDNEVISTPEITILQIEQKMEDLISGCLGAQLELQVQIEAGTVTTKEQIDQTYAAVADGPALASKSTKPARQKAPATKPKRQSRGRQKRP